jgi:hypothetical protein
MKTKDDPEIIILASVAMGFIREKSGMQPTHYKMETVNGPLLLRWPDGRWYEVNVRERKTMKGNKK